MLTIWGRRSSFNVQKVMWLIAELGLAHRHVPAGGDAGGCDTPEFTRLNPHQRIPVVDWDGQVVWESHAILRYLAARAGRSPFWSDDPHVRSTSERWMDWSQSTLEPEVMLGLFWALVRTPVQARDAALIRRKQLTSALHFQRLDAILARQPYLSGATFGLGDIPAGATLYRYFAMDIDRPRVPHVEAWYQRLQARPAYAQHVMVSFDELVGKPDRGARLLDLEQA